MKAIKHITDDDLVEIGNAYSRDLSFYVAGWDYSNTGHERAAERRCQSKANVIDAEMKRRGLTTTCSTLCPLGVR